MLLFQRVRLVSEKFAGSQANLGRELGLHERTFQNYLKEDRQDNLWPWLGKICEIYPQIRREWLWWGEGEMLKSDPPANEAAPVAPPPAPVSAPPELVMPSQYTQPVPLVGFASCSVFGWHGTMSIPVPVEPPTWHPDMFAVMATGESMLPAGIGHGHICYCDPNKAPGKDEAVYVETSDELGTIKLFCGRSARGGGEYINLRGWLDIDPKTGTQKPMLLDVLASSVKRIAPVMYVRRRL